MTKAGTERDAAPPAEPDGSSESRFRPRFARGLASGPAAVLALAVAAGLAMIAADLLLVFSVEVGATSCEATASPDVSDLCATSGGERHSYALVLLGLFTLAMAWGATAGRSRPAGVALVVVGAVVLAIALLGDLPDAYSEGIIGTRYEAASASPGAGLWLELAGGALAVAAGALRLGRPS
jgi:hypothetical protein